MRAADHRAGLTGGTRRDLQVAVRVARHALALVEPTGVARDRELRCLVHAEDTEAARLSRGQPRRGARRGVRAAIAGPRDLAVDAVGDRLVVDAGRARAGRRTGSEDAA